MLRSGLAFLVRQKRACAIEFLEEAFRRNPPVVPVNVAFVLVFVLAFALFQFQGSNRLSPLTSLLLPSITLRQIAATLQSLLGRK